MYCRYTIGAYAGRHHRVPTGCEVVCCRTTNPDGDGFCSYSALNLLLLYIIARFFGTFGTLCTLACEIAIHSLFDRILVIVKKSLNDFISETLNDKLKAALGGADIQVPEPVQSAPSAEANDSDDSEAKKEPNIITTEEELEAYFIVKNLLKEVVPISEITYKDTESYINILHKANSRRWICRLKLTPSQKTLIIPDENKKDVKYQLKDIYDLMGYADQLSEVLKRYL